MMPGQVRLLRNVHSSAQAALDAWLKGTLWGDPIRLGPDKFHVYGCYKRNWTPVAVEFTSRMICVMRRRAE